MKRRNLRLAALPVAVLLAVGMAACGGDDEGSSGTGSGSTTEVSGNLAGVTRRVRVGMILLRGMSPLVRCQVRNTLVVVAVDTP